MPSAAADVATPAASPYLRPKQAASLIILDRSGRETTVLMGGRHHSHVFLPGRYFFPGGRLEREDALMPVATPLQAAVAARLPGTPAWLGRGLALAAIRETFEETGLCLGVRAAAGRPRSAIPASWRTFAAQDILPDLAALQLVARALTPTGPPRRFDAHFFCADAATIVHRAPGVVHAESELVELVWVSLAAARALPIAGVTRFVLEALERRLASDWSPAAPVPFFSWPRGTLRHVEL